VRVLTIENCLNADWKLLRDYAENGSEEAFAEIVSKHLNLVYSTARRLVGGDSHMARDVAQIVFFDLARKARSISRSHPLESWLYQATRYVASKAVRTEQRRLKREAEAINLHSHGSEDRPFWDQLSPLLDQAINVLTSRDRDAIVLHFLAQKDYAAIAEVLGTSAEGARKQVNRALEHLRKFFKRHGVNASSSALATLIAQNTIEAAPAGIAPAISAGAVAAAAAAPLFVTQTLYALGSMNLKVIAAWIGVGLAVVTPLVLQHNRISTLEARNRQLQTLVKQTEPASNDQSLQSGATKKKEQENLLELMRLRAEVRQLRQTQRAPDPAKSPTPAVPSDTRPPWSVRLDQILAGPVTGLGQEGGNVRQKMLNHQPLNDSDQSLLGYVVKYAPEIEKNPEEFARFQTAFLAALLSWNSDARQQEIEKILLEGAKEAADRGFNFTEPGKHAFDWSEEQKSLNRRTTERVQELLHPDERPTFDHALLGVLGIDFGVGFQ